ncbi:hypothetical protein DRJ00_04100 [Candidatus Aerophobetes bacterium]|uniref:Uncharacterized protein n=1 Tax=Aerophobetes bacterium TaxID=2030807 RepID=A0A497E3Y2_UNCAE|nr:MAG: hypothetical protein DRJ00_04100 [Candidatus Aerophobetes bacterium]
MRKGNHKGRILWAKRNLTLPFPRDVLARFGKRIPAVFNGSVSENNYESFVTGNDGGYFCPNGKVVVLDYDKFAEIASADKPNNFSDSFWKR